jgi:adenosylcobinamide-GDP ribazoletransferase
VEPIRNRFGSATMTTVAAATEGRTSAVLAELLAAVGFLTRLPVPSLLRRPVGARTGAGWFGVVGAGIGMVGGLPLVAIGGSLPLAAAILSLALVVGLSGAFHLDGLADTADALVAPTPDAAERARRDPHAGPAGIVALVLLLGLDAALLASLAITSPGMAGLAVVAAAGGSRATAPVAALLFGGGRRTGGTADHAALAAWFGARVAGVEALVAVVTALVVALITDVAGGGGRFIVGTTIGLLVGVAAAATLRRLRHGLDGDGYGATIEIAFAGTLVAIAIQAI